MRATHKHTEGRPRPHFVLQPKPPVHKQKNKNAITRIYDTRTYAETNVSEVIAVS